MQIPERQLHRPGRVRLEVPFQLACDVARVLIGNEAHGDLGPGRGRENGLRPLALVTAPDAVHVQRRARPDGFEDRVALLRPRDVQSDRAQPGALVERKLADGAPLLVGELPDVFVEARNRNAVLMVVQPGDEPAQHADRILHGAAVHAGMQISVRAGEQHLRVGETAQAVRDRGLPLAEHGRVRYERHVGGEQVAVLLQERAQVHGSAFLFALDEKIQVDRQLAAGPEVRFGRLGVDEELPLVVARAPPVEGAVTHGRLEGRRVPQVEGIRRLYVVMPVYEHRGAVVARMVFAGNDRMARRLVDADVAHPHRAQVIGEPRCRRADVVGIGRVRADRRDAQQLLQLVQESGLRVGSVCQSVGHRCVGSESVIETGLCRRREQYIKTRSRPAI